MFQCGRTSVAAVVGILFASSSVGQSVQDLETPRMPVPSSFELLRAEREVRELYKEQYAVTDREEVRKFAGRLLQAGRGETRNPPLCFVLLREARDIAAKIGDAPLAFAGVDAAHELFEVDVGELRESTVESVRRTAREPRELEALAHACTEIAREAYLADDYPKAENFVKTAQTAASRLTEGSLSTRLKEYARQISVAAKAHRGVRRDLDRLSADPADAAANLAVGKFLCFSKGAWEQGLPLLAKSDEDHLMKAAAKDLAAASAGATAAPLHLVEAGTLWANAARKLKGSERQSAMLRASGWFVADLIRLTGLDRERAAKNIAHVSQIGSTLSLAASDPARPSGLTVAEFNGKDMSVLQPISGEWRVASKLITHEQLGIVDVHLRSLLAADWLSVEFEFMGGNPGLYFSVDGTAESRLGINLDESGEFNRAIQRDVDMERWNLVLMSHIGNEFVFLLNGERVYSMPAVPPSFVLVKAQRGAIQVRKFRAVGYNP